MQSLLAKLDYVPSGVIHNLDEGDPEIVYFQAAPVRIHHYEQTTALRSAVLLLVHR
jgi:hypothetical protein